MKVANHKEIIEAVSMETGHSMEVVQFVVSSFWKTLRYYLIRPHLTKFGILIDCFVTFRLPKRRLLKEVDRIHTRRPVSNRFNDLVRLVKIQKEYEEKWKVKTSRQERINRQKQST